MKKLLLTFSALAALSAPAAAQQVVALGCGQTIGGERFCKTSVNGKIIKTPYVSDREYARQLRDYRHVTVLGASNPSDDGDQGRERADFIASN